MKILYMLVFLLIAQIATGYSSNLGFPPCQEIIASIVTSDPATNNGFVEICVGEELTVTGEGVYPENGMYYLQADSTSVFKWHFGDGFIADSTVVTHAFDQPGVFNITLEIMDWNDCQSENLEILKVKVAPMAIAAIDASPGTLVCQGVQVELEANIPASQTIYPTNTVAIVATVPIPDGSGATYSDTIEVFSFPGAVITSSDELEICVNMEHSYMRDLDINLTCPNG